MIKNVGTTDKILRVLAALGFFSSYFFTEGNMKFIALIGFVPLLTAAFSFCPLYPIFGINTCKSEAK